MANYLSLSAWVSPVAVAVTQYPEINLNTISNTDFSLSFFPPPALKFDSFFHTCQHYTSV